MPFDTIVVPYLALLALTWFAAFVTLQVERPRRAAAVVIVLATVTSALVAFGVATVIARIRSGGSEFGDAWVAENLSGAARLPIGYGGLVVPPVLVAVFAFVRGRGPILSLSEPKAIGGASIRTRRAFYSWAIWGVVGVAAGVTGLVLSWAER